MVSYTKVSIHTKSRRLCTCGRGLLRGRGVGGRAELFFRGVGGWGGESNVLAEQVNKLDA